MSVFPSGEAASREMTLVCASSFASGLGASPPGLSGSSHKRIWPRLLPAAIRRDDPSHVTAVTQSASQVRFHACVGFARFGMGHQRRGMAAKKHKKHKENQDKEWV